ncbi:VOC family protein [Actinokineospora auranticolor]|uniref:Glyoxalase-like protein n=1 Tax=Actinokineospora auranticolor TaxID=155976 RepID=A0A2S6GPJ8_9PSEU|nr:VOC family protein [Actinokineospora auranticolor]PPK67093.1 glyoxalase-like protein [Actinokineospora auranticolor]
MKPRIDHVLLGARTVEPVRELLWDRYGFGLTDGSPNPDGTASWVVPFDTPEVQYLEVLVVHDEKALADKDFGKLFLERTAQGPALLNWAVLVEDIEAVAAGVRSLTGADPDLYAGESVRADGQVVPWAEAAFALSWESGVLPFFLRYGNAEARAARVPADLAAAGHRVCPTAITGLLLGAASAHDHLTDRWPTLDALPVRHSPAGSGPGEGPLAVQISTVDGPVTLELP